jgi:Domain of Unknown Function (DUF1080)
MGRTMRCLLLCGLVGVLVSGAAGRPPADDDAKHNTLTAAEREQGWKLLFDGKTTTGWRKYRGEGVPDMWKVSDGVLVLDPASGTQHGDLVTTDPYKSFELTCEWKIAPGGNSGIMYHVAETEDAPYMTGPEYQLVDNARHPDGKHAITSAASCYALYPPSKDVTHPAGRWNKTKLIVNGNHVEHWLNGVKVVEYELGNTDWQERVQKSKFHEMQHFGKEATGHIDLQDHGDKVEFRDIKVRVLEQ